MSNDEAIIQVQEGQAAWKRLKRSNSIRDWILCGRALLVGRRVAMEQAGVRKPEGGKYAKHFGRWIRANGFADVADSARNRAMQIASKETSVMGVIPK
jgi:hypothetical protein